MEHSEVLRHRECRRQPGGTADRRFACGLQSRGKTGSRSRSTLDPGRSGRHRDVSPQSLQVLTSGTSRQLFTVTVSCANLPTWRSAPSGMVRAAVDSAARTDFQKMRQSESHDSNLLLALSPLGCLPVARGRPGRSVDPERHCRLFQRQAPALHR